MRTTRRLQTVASVSISTPAVIVAPPGSRSAAWALLAPTLAVLLAAACSKGPDLSEEALEDVAVGKGLPEGFLLGTATSSHQIEGGNVNDWTDWEAQPGNIADDTVSGLAADSWNRFDEDLALMLSLGVKSYRFSVEWSRLEPTEGAWDAAAAARYLDWAQQLNAAGIKPMVTLYHFTLPRWIAAKGGWTSDETVEHFEAFAARVAELLGEEVDLWCTVNEPNVIAVNSYLEGIWPPGVSDQVISAQVLARLIKAHAGAARQLRALDTTDSDGDGHATRVGLAHHVRVFQPATTSFLDTLIAGITDDFFNEAVVRAGLTGRIHLSVPGTVEIDEQVPDLAGSFDYLGINYYTRDHVRADLGDPSLSQQYVPDGRPVNELGWDIYPEGLYDFLMRYSGLGIPLYVTENGMADNEGTRRPGYLERHLYAVERAIADGADVRGYYHWSLLDNFEWAEGYEPRFGLFAVDFDDPQRARTPTPAATTFQEIAGRMP